MIKLVRHTNNPYNCGTELEDLNNIANEVHLIPRDWLSEDGLLPNERFVDYVKPLIEGETRLPMDAGLPKFVILEKVPVEKKLPPR